MQFTRLPFGLKTACATFIILMRKVILGLKNTECYFDNIVVHNSSWDEHVSVDISKPNPLPEIERPNGTFFFFF